MKIVNNGGASDCSIWIEGKRISRPDAKLNCFAHIWDDSDIEKLLTESQYRQFEAGKYIFDIPAWKINIITCNGFPRNKEQLLFSTQFD